MSPSPRPRVLIADDHPAMLVSLQRLISVHCEVVGTVLDGDDLLASATRLQPDVVIADLNMPTVTGLEACRRLRQSHPGIGVILLTGTDDKETEERARAVGASAFLVKYALAPEQLIDSIRQACVGPAGSRGGDPLTKALRR